ncbi:MAG: NAD(P)H-binding protein [Nannocystales bacterium]
MTGATGHLGANILSHLRTRNALKHLVLGARDPSQLAPGALPARRVDYDDIGSMREAFAGVSDLLLISSNAAHHVRRRQHAAAVDIAAEAGVNRIVYTSFVGADRPGTNELLEVHHATERKLRESGVPWVALRNGVYMDSLPRFLGPFRETGVVAHPTGDAPVAWTSRADIAALTADILLDGSVRNQVIDVASSQPRSFPSIVQEVATSTGQRVALVQPTEDEYRAMLGRAGLDQDTVEIFSAVCRAMREGQLNVSSHVFESRLGRSPESVSTYLARAEL